MDYKLVLFGNGIYKEIELDLQNCQQLLIGTTPECRIRFNREYFFEDFVISAAIKNGQWTLGCLQNVCFKTGGLLKQSFVTLTAGDSLTVCYEKNDGQLFQIDFMYDRERQGMTYDKYVEIGNLCELMLGNAAGCHIQINDEIIQNEYALLTAASGEYYLSAPSQRLALYKNGYKAAAGTAVKISDSDFFSIAGYSFCLLGGCLYFNGMGKISTALPVYTVKESVNRQQYPKFQKNARQEYVMTGQPIEVLAPKSMPSEPKRNLVMTLVPVIAALVLMVALRGVMGGGGMFVIYSVATMALGGIMSVWTYINDGKEYRKNKALREEKYEAYIEVCREKLERQREKELAVMNYTYVSPDVSAGFVFDFDSRLFERRPKDRDYLTVYLGSGYVPTALPVKCREIEYKDVEDDLQDYPSQLRDEYAYLKNAPVVLDLKTVNAAGIVGNENKLYQMLKNIVFDLAVRHYYADVKFYFIFSEDKKNRFYWMRWLKNAYNTEEDTRSFMYDEESYKRGLEFLYGELSRRESDKENKKMFLPHYIVFVYESALLNSHPIARYISIAKTLGFTFIFLEKYIELLSADCNVMVTLDETSNQGSLIDCADGRHYQNFAYPHISSETVTSCALKMGSVYADEISLEKSLTKNISLYELLGIMNADDLNLKKRWAASKIYESMAAPLGVKSGDEIVKLDLHEKYHGPHGLVAGTTGSGKSELLQTYILSMATLYHPYEVGFVIIDFKGGGMVNQFRNLPHLNGAITNIDDGEIERSLLSIRAELRKRQELFAKYDVNHIDEYIKKYKNKETDIPLPHLILIVDEFAELKSDQPEFMKELISTARIGRSLGVHLILATQKPSGVVDNQIWSNSKFKLCLKVQNREDSMEVLKSPLASEIKEAGRAYLQVGNTEIFQLFQSAYSGAWAEGNHVGMQSAFTLSKIALSGHRDTIYRQKPVKNEGGKRQLEALVDYVHHYCEANHIEKLPPICLEPLAEILPWPKQSYYDVQPVVTVPVGMLDDPERQSQREFMVDFTRNHIFILGSARYGKTNVLMTMIHGLSQIYTPKEVNIYILDFASMMLKRFEGLAHVGGVVTSVEDEKLKTFMKMMASETKRRKEILLRSGLGSFEAYKRSGHNQLPQIIIMIDNVAAFRELYEKFENQLLALCREGLSLGISVVASNLQTSGFGYKYLSNFAGRICLYCNDSNEYGYLFDHCKKKLKNVPGRALTEIDRKTYEIQVYQAFDGEDEMQQAEAAKAYIERINKNNPGLRAVKIPEIPSVLTKAYIDRNFPDICCRPYEIFLGIDYATTELTKMSMLNQGVLGLCGVPHMGKTNFIRYMLTTLSMAREKAPVECYIIDSVDKKLSDFSQFPIVRAYTADISEYKMMLGYFIHVMEERYQWMIDGMEEKMESAPLLLWMVQNNDVIAELSGDREMMKLYHLLCTKYRALKICIIYTDLENAAINYSAPEVLKQLRDGKNFLIFTNIGEQKLCDVAYSVSKEYAKPLEAGEAYHFSGSTVCKIKTVLMESEAENGE